MDPRYPIGNFTKPQEVTAEQRHTSIGVLRNTPNALRATVENLSPQQLDTPYREGGWTVRQLVHHVPDSHINAYVRFRLGLTEDNPTIRTYEEAEWAKLPDSQDDIAVSLDLLDAIHIRWVRTLENMSSKDWERTIEHPEIGPMRLDQLLAMYDWHSRHHVAHVTTLRREKGW